MGHPFLIPFLLNLLFYTNLTFPWRIYVENRKIFQKRLTPAIEKDNLFFSVIDFLRKNSKTYIYLKNVVSDRAKVYYEYDRQYYNRENEYYKKSIKTIEDISILSCFRHKFAREKLS